MTTDNLSILDRRTYTALHRASQALLLGLLWTIAALPVITAVPASAALMAVVRERDMHPGLPLARRFFRHLRAHWRQTTILGVAFTGAAAVLIFNISLASAFKGLLGPVLMSAAIIPSMITLGITFNYIFHLACYEATWRSRLRICVLLTIGRPATTIACTIALAVVALGTYWIPILPIFTATTATAMLMQASSRGLEALTTDRSIGAAQ